MKYFSLPALALGYLPAWGQALPTAPPPPFARFYLGVGASTCPTSLLTGPLLPSVELGYQWRPRLAVQGSFMAYASHAGLVASGSAYVVSSNGTTRYGPLIRYSSQARGRSSVGSVAARYTLTRQWQRRLQFEVVGGLLFDHTRRHYDMAQTDSAGTVLAASTLDGTTNEVRLQLGPGLRYELGRHLGFSLGLTLNHAATNLYLGNFGLVGAAGLRYRWGYR